MNERIRELSYEAQRYALNNTTGPDLAGLNELWQEKFAELIVAECIDTVSDCSVEYCTRPQIVSEIREHFGVES